MSTNDVRAQYLELIRQRGFGHIADQLELFWFLPEIMGIFCGLLLDQDRGNRHGFPAEVYRAIMKLYTIYCFDRGEVDRWINTYFPNKNS